MTYANIDTDNGHDGFLLPNPTYEALLSAWSVGSAPHESPRSRYRFELGARRSRVLDLGCGDGAFLARLSEERGAIGVGVDIDPANLVTAVSRGLDVIQEDINDGLHCFTTNRFDVVILAHALQELTHPHIALQRMVDIADEAIVSFPNFGHWSCRLHLGVKGRMPMSRVMPRHWYDTPNIHFLHRYGLRRTVLSTSHRHYRASDHRRSRTALFGPLVPQSFRYQRHLPYPSLWRLIGLLLVGLAIEPALGQQSTRFDQFELHHSIVYTTFLSPQVAAEYGITRGADKAILTLSVRDANCWGDSGQADVY